MIAVITVLAAFPLGFLLRSHFVAATTYVLAYLWAFTFQTLYLLLDSLDGGAAPAFTVGEFPLSYGAVALAVLVVGLGLVVLGHRVGRNHRARRTARRDKDAQDRAPSSRTGTTAKAASGNTAASAKVAG